MTTTDRTSRRYLEKLTFWLRMRDLSGERIGDILAEAEAHIAASGETLREAFGPPRRYADQWGEPARRSWLRTIPSGVLSLIGGTALGFGANALGRGEPAPFGLPASWTALVGLVGFVAAIAFTPADVVRDPRTGAGAIPSRFRWLLGALAACAGLGVLMFLLGLATAALG